MTKHGIKYYAYFIDASIYHPAFTDVYTFNIETETDTPHPIRQWNSPNNRSYFKIILCRKAKCNVNGM